MKQMKPSRIRPFNPMPSFLINASLRRASIQLGKGEPIRKWDRLITKLWHLWDYWPWEHYAWKKMRKETKRLELKLFGKEM